MRTYILQENVLTDNILLMPEDGQFFKGGYIAIIKEYTFLNAWNDKESVIKFRKEKRLTDYLLKNYPNAYFELSYFELS